jgi:hypothetical protein
VFVSSWSRPCAVAFSNFVRMRHNWDVTALPVYSQAGGNKEFSVRYHSLDVCLVARSFLEGEGDGDVISLQREEIPRQILQGSLRTVFSPSTFAQALFMLVNTSTNTPILQHFITSSPLHGVICSYSDPVPSSSFAQYRHTVGHASTAHKAPSSNHCHCWLLTTHFGVSASFL